MILLRQCFGPLLHKVRPPDPSVEVVQFMASLQMTPGQVYGLWKMFQSLKAYDPLTLTTGPGEISTDSVPYLIKNRRQWVRPILIDLLKLGGFEGILSWDGFLYILLRFCTLSRCELAQVMFFIIAMHMKTWTVQYLTAAQLAEFYSPYEVCPVPAFSTANLDFGKLPLAKYRMVEFIQLTYQYSQLVNPCYQLQRSLQQVLLGLRFWENIDRIRHLNRKMTIEFFRPKKSMSLLELVRGIATAENEDLIVPGQTVQESAASRKMARHLHEAALVVADGGTGIQRNPGVTATIPLPMGYMPARRWEEKPEEVPVPQWLRDLLGVTENPQEQLEERRKAIENAPLLGGAELPKNIEAAKEMVLQTHGPKRFGKKKFSMVEKSEEVSESTLGDIARKQELEFIRKSRAHEIPRDNIVQILDRVTSMGLVNRPKKLPTFV